MHAWIRHVHAVQAHHYAAALVIMPPASLGRCSWQRLLSAWLVSAWLLSAWLVSAWLVSAWLVSAWLVSAWLLSAWLLGAWLLGVTVHVYQASMAHGHAVFKFIMQQV